jgi:glycosyltransferase involved in cell wall biosynthesis
MNNISVLVPCYNEAKNLINLLPRINEVMSDNKLVNTFEIIVINDGSNDDTENIVNKIKLVIKNLCLINLKQNMGKAFALDIGIRKSKGNIIASIDSDLQYEPEDFLKMIAKLDEGNDFVNGRRIIRKDSYFISLFSFVYNFFLRKIFKCNVFDFFSGIKVYKKKIYELINLNSLPRFIIFFSAKYSFKIIEIDIKHNERIYGKSAYNFFDRVILALQDMFVIFLCIILRQDRIYVFKQILLIFFFFSSIISLFLSLKIENYDNTLGLILIIIFMTGLVFFKIIESFFEKKTQLIDVDEFIKSINS